MKSIKTRYKVIGATLVILASIAIATPLAVEFYLVKWLHSAGATSADIGTVGVNLVTGRLWIRDLKANDPGGDRQLEIGEVSINLAWVELIRGRIGIDGASLQDSQINIERTSDAIHVGGLRFELPTNGDVPPPSSSEPLAIGLGPVTISNVTFGYSDELLSEQFVISQLTMGEAATWLSLEQTPVEIDLRLASGTAHIKGSIRPFLEEIDVDLSVVIAQVDISSYEKLLSNFGINSAAGVLGLSGDAELRILATGVAGNARLTASLASASLAMPSHGVDQVSGSFELDASTTMTSGPSGQDIEASANVRLIDAGTRIRDLEVALQELASDITVAYRAGEAAALNGTAKLAMKGFSSSIRPARTPLLELGSIVVDSLEFSSDNIQIAGVNLSDVHAFKHYHPQGIQMRSLVVGPSDVLVPREDRALNLSIEQIDIEGVDAYLARQEDGSVLYASIVDDIRLAAGIAAPDPGEAGPSPSPSPRLTLGGVSVKQAELEIHDLAVSPPLVTNIKSMELTIGSIDTSEPVKRTSITLLLSQDDLMTVKLEGNITVVAPRPSADLALNLAGLQLNQVSAYIPGYQISRGRFSLDSIISIQDGDIDIGNKMVIDDLRIATKAGSDVPALASTLAMPLDLALDLLRDRNGRIALEIPVTGNVENPEFSLDDIIATAMGRAMQKAAMSYVKTALQPLGALLMVGSLTQKATRPRFEPVKFDAGESTINQVAQDYLDKMSGLLTSRPGLTISVCGVTTEKDRQVLLARKQEQAEQGSTGTDAETTTSKAADANAGPPAITVTAVELVALGNDRASAVTSYFIGSRDLEPDRIFSCSSTIETGPEATPRVQLLL